MSNRIAVFLAGFLLLLLILDAALSGFAAVTFLAQRLIRLTEWLAFWR